MGASANPAQTTQAVAPAAPTPTPAAPQNIYQQSSQAYNKALSGTQAGIGYQPQNVSATNVGTQFGYTPQSVSAPTAVGGISTYMNPYTQQVIDTSMADLERQRQMQMNQLGAQATQAGAFGGSRQGVAEALTNEAFARQGGQLAAGLRQQGFNTALGAAQQDVATGMQASLANQAAQAAAQQFGQSTSLQAQQANQQARLQAALANQQAGLAGAQQRLSAAGQMGNLSNLGFGFGQQIQQQQMMQGALQQALQQKLIDDARAQYQGFVGAPQQALGVPLQALGAAPVPQTTTQTSTRTPGLFDYLTIGATAFSSDPRLKTNIQPKGEFKGVKFYTWDWNEEGEKIARPGQPTFGVMADELQKTHPHLVIRGEDGYLRVNYSQLSKELAEAA